MTRGIVRGWLWGEWVIRWFLGQRHTIGNTWCFRSMIEHNKRIDTVTRRNLIIAKLSACSALATLAAGMNAGMVQAQEAPVQTASAEAEQTVLESIVVTGSLIRNPNLVSSAPVNVIGAEEIQFRQSTNAEELLRDLPGIVPSIGSAVNNGNGGASFVNLRGLGSFRNIVLLNNTRLVPAGLGGQVDLNNIPVSLIERTDILTGGASTTYGADAVSGVVNFVTKRDFSGVEVNVSDQITERGDGNQFRVDLTIGANFDDGRGNVALSIGYQDSDAVFQGDRPFSVDNIASEDGSPGGSGTTVPTRFTGARPVIAGTTTPNTSPTVNNLGLTVINPTTGVIGGAFTPFNFNPFNIFQTPYNRFNIFGTGRYEVADGIEVYSEALFSKNSVSTIIAPSGLFNTSVTVPLSNPFLSATTRNQFCAFNTAPAGSGTYTPRFTQAVCDAAAVATDPSDPNYRTVTVNASRRFTEAGPRISEFTTTIFQIKAGLRGDITESISYDIYGTYGESENIQRQSGNGTLSRARQAILATDTNSCINPAGGCVPLDIFGPEGSITPEQFAFLNVSASSSTLTSLGTARGIISGDAPVSSPLAETPVGFAVGGEYRGYRGSSISDLLTQTPGEVLGNGAANPDVTGTYNVYEAFGELIVPVVEDRFLAKNLTVEVGGRYSNYNTTGTSFTYKAGGTWEPVTGFKLRGNWQRATRSPNLAELFSPQVTGLDNFAVDPCQGGQGGALAPETNAAIAAICNAQGGPAGFAAAGLIEAPSAGQVNVTSGGNPELDVERATTWTVGGVFQPDYIPGFALTIDYYKIRINEAITTPTIGDALDACFSSTFNPTFAVTDECLAIRRNPATGQISGDVADTPGVPLFLSNLGVVNTDGIDLTASYQRNVGPMRLNFVFNGNWTKSNRFQATPSAIDRECIDLYSVNCGSPAGGTGSIQPEFSFNLRSTVSYDKYDLSLRWRYVDAVSVEPEVADQFLEEFRRIKARHYLDLTMRASVHENLDLTFSVINLTDVQPPVVGSTIGTTAFNSGNTYPSTYDPLGRRYALSAKLKF